MNIKYMCVNKYYTPDIKYIVCGSFVDIINDHKINYCRFFPGFFLFVRKFLVYNDETNSDKYSTRGDFQRQNS